MENQQRTAVITQACQLFDNDKQRLMDILREVQDKLRGIDNNVMDIIAVLVGLSRIEIAGVVSFYAFFSQHQLGKINILLCDDIVDRYAGMEKVAAAFKRELGLEIGQTDEQALFSLGTTPCIGMCDQAPAALINNIVVTQLTPERVVAMIMQLRQHQDPSKLKHQQGEGNNQHPLVKSMVKNHIRHSGEILLSAVPSDSELKSVLSLAPARIIDCIEEAKLRGRGGAGFSTGQKWRIAASTQANQRYVICNADEGEPGTFKDRVLLTEQPHLLIEGMTIAARAINADSGIIYLRGEYAYLEPFLQQVLRDRQQRGLLGKDIGDVAGFTFDIRIQLGAGAYICGEESALISSCEGLRGEPKTRPPFPVVRGYLNCPTVVNNVETFCCAARIIDRGADWFKAIGTAESAGTKLFSISGDCAKPGVYELPFGITVTQLLKKAGAQDAAAVLMGGPSGELINSSAFGRKICFEDLPTGGAVVVFNSTRNILEIVEYYLDFFIEESCGYCTPCRVGNVFLKERINKIRKGLAEPDDLKYLHALSDVIIKTSRCGLGQTSPHPVISSLKNFPLIYSALVKERPDGLQASFDIQTALETSRRLAKRRSFIYDPSYDE